MSRTEYRWLNNQGVRASCGFDLQREDRFTMTYREGDRAITIDIEDGIVGGQYAVLISPGALRSWDDGSPLGPEKETKVLDNIRAALAFQELGLCIE